jgi:hypothetical protein
MAIHCWAVKNSLRGTRIKKAVPSEYSSSALFAFACRALQKEFFYQKTILLFHYSVFIYIFRSLALLPLQNHS